MILAHVLGGGGEEALAQGGLLLFWMVLVFFVSCATGLAALAGLALTRRVREGAQAASSGPRWLARLTLGTNALCLLGSLAARLISDAAFASALWYAIGPALIACGLSLLWLMRLNAAPAR